MENVNPLMREILSNFIKTDTLIYENMVFCQFVKIKQMPQGHYCGYIKPLSRSPIARAYHATIIDKALGKKFKALDVEYQLIKSLNGCEKMPHGVKLELTYFDHDENGDLWLGFDFPEGSNVEKIKLALSCVAANIKTMTPKNMLEGRLTQIEPKEV